MNVANNKIYQLPTDFTDIPKLNIVDLSNNLLTSLPDSICDMKTLRMLYVSDNCLSKLPENIGNLINLEVVSNSTNPKCNSNLDLKINANPNTNGYPKTNLGLSPN